MKPEHAAVLPILLPLAFSLLVMFGRGVVRYQRAVVVGAMGLNLFACTWLFQWVRREDVPLEISFGGWNAPVGIAFYVDLLSATMVLVTALIAFCGALYALGDVGRRTWGASYGFFLLLLITGINGAFLTNDLFNLFVWFEVMLMASFAMMALGRRRFTIEGTTKYVVINMVSSFFLLAGLGLLYGKAGNLNLNIIAERLGSSSDDPIILTSCALLLMAFGIKAGVFPLYFWLPASYPNTGFTSAAVFGGLLTKVGVYAFFRVFGGAFAFFSELTGDIFIIVGVATMITGVLGAASQMYIRKILSFHIISQIGYLILCLGLFTKGAFAAAIFYTVHHIIVKTNLFFVAGMIAKTGRAEDLNKLGGLMRSSPLLAVLFAIPALSLGGIPPLSGFFAKLFVIQEAFEVEAYLVATAALAVGLLTLFSMTKIWSEAFWKDSPRNSPLCRFPKIQLVPVAILCSITLFLGFGVGPSYQISEQAAEQLWNQNSTMALEEETQP
ncbi:MAG: proton-conducting transporter membrane subunit [Verrucomicrobiota bacterium]